ncbi:MAG: hypothetical protein H7330_07930 [Hymenobacteraceae bacterium]|nr:hypothetical protein [Hymenobacteraceae bacterium]
MKHLWSTTLTSLLVGSTLLFSACKKDKNGDVTPVGSISGKFEPANSISKVTATDTTGNTTAVFTTTPVADGTFAVDNLLAGNYTLSFSPKTGYTAPAARAVTVEAGATTDQGTITVAPTGGGASGGTLTYKVGGTAVTATTVAGSYGSNILLLLGNTGTTPSTTQVLGISVPSITGPGTFSISSGAANGTYTRGSAGWSTGGGGTGSVVVTTFNTTTRKASGTFSFTAPALSGSSATGSKAITNGIFTNVSFQ